MFQEDFEKVVLKYITLSGGSDRLLFVFHPLVHEYRQSRYYFPFENLFEVLNQTEIFDLRVVHGIGYSQLAQSSTRLPGSGLRVRHALKISRLPARPKGSMARARRPLPLR
jgi:hypothetical protein